MDAFLQAAALVFTPTSLIYMFLGVFFKLYPAEWTLIV